MHRTLGRFRRHLASQGLRLTPTREHVLLAVLRQRGHFGAEHVLEAASRAGHTASRASVYRTLPHLENAGLVRRMAGRGATARWVVVEPLSPDDALLVCVSCGRMDLISVAMLEKVARRLCRARGFTLTTPFTELHGLCAACADVTKSAGRRGGRPSR